MILEEYLLEVAKLVPGEALPLGQTEIIKAVYKALSVHSRIRPRIVVEDIAGTGSFDYATASLSSWDVQFSRIIQVEYPVDDTSDTPNILEDDEWNLYEKPSGSCLRFVAAIPAVGESIRVTYTALHGFDDSDVCTVPACDEEGVQCLAASYFADMLAAYYAQNQEATLGAEVVDQTSKRREYAALAKRYEKQYEAHMGLGQEKVKPASYTQDQDVVYPWGLDRVTHPRKYR